MQIKRFQAATMAEALELVKRDLGSEAVILSACSRKDAKGLFGPFKRAAVEVTAAGNGPLPPSKPAASFGDAYHVTLESRPEPVAANRPSPPGMTRRVSYSTPQKPLRSPMGRRSSRRTAVRNYANGSTDGAHHWLFRRLLDQGVEEDYVREMVAEGTASVGLPDREPEDAVGPLAGILEQVGVTAGPPEIEDGRQKRIAVIGATGVGKTTAVAKLAAVCKLDDNLRVAMITLDTVRVAASDQLRAFADIIGVPLESAADQAGLESALDACRQYDLVLIDTPALNVRQPESVQRLAELLGAAGPLEVALLVSATSRLRDNLDLYERATAFGIDHLMFSKVDETVDYGDILNLLLRLQRPVSFFFDGAAGPDGARKADLNVLAGLLAEKRDEGRGLSAPVAVRRGEPVTRPVPMRWQPLPQGAGYDSDSEQALMDDGEEAPRGRSRSGFFRFNGKNKKVTTA